MKRVIIESPFAGKTREERDRNILYARAALRDSLLRDEAPYASHLLYTQPGVLRDDVVEERAFGMRAGLTWTAAAELVAVYQDLGVSPGMQSGITRAEAKGVPVEMRNLHPDIFNAIMRGDVKTANAMSTAVSTRGRPPSPVELSDLLRAVGIDTSPSQLIEAASGPEDVVAADEWARMEARVRQGEIAANALERPSWLESLVKR